MARETREGRRISDALLDELLAGQDPAKVFHDGTLIDDLKKAVAERALDAKMEVHLGRESEQAPGNHRNGHNRKLVSAGLGYRRRHLNSTLACTPRRCATTETESPDR